MDLYEGRRLTNTIRKVQDRIDVLQAKAEFTGPKLSHTAGCGGFRFESKIENFMAEIDELERIKAQLITQRARERLRITQDIARRAVDGQQALVLYLFYIAEKSNTWIAEALGLSLRYVIRRKQDVV